MQAGGRKEFDRSDWLRRLYALNPWADRPLAPAKDAGLPGDWEPDVDGFSDPFDQARLQAALKRWAEGKDAWNAWAKAMWGLRKELEAAELWAKDHDEAADEQHLFLHYASVEFDGLCLSGNTYFSEFLFPGCVSFCRTCFGDKDASPGDASFYEAQFHGGVARFDWAQFHGGDARFDCAQFHGGAAWFRCAQFHGGAARFDWAQFHGGAARFGGAQFYAPAKTALGSTDFEVHYTNFAEAVFKKTANFERCQINSQITFARARFDGAANFKGVRSNVGFTLSDAYFHRVPDFTESVFHRTPRLDNVKVRPTWFGPLTEFSEPKTWQERLNFWRRLTWDPDAPAKFRELKRFAIEGQDGRSELTFHAEEIRSARWVKDMPWHPSFLFGYLYGIFSDFGRSVLRPALFWTVTTAVFSAVYTSAHIHRNQRAAQYGIHYNGSLIAMPVAAWQAWENKLPCMEGDNRNIIALNPKIREDTTAFAQAVRLSLANAIVFGDLGGSEGARLTYGCLFGLERLEPHDQDKPWQERRLDDKRGWSSTTYVPPGVAWAMNLQKFLSAVLIFLFGLGLRNMLKLK